MLPAMILLLMAAPPEVPKFTEAAQKELQKLEGKWEVILIEANGKSYEPEKGEILLIIKGTKLSFPRGEKVVSGEAEFVSLDSKTSPKCIDFRIVDLPDLKRDGPIVEAIYKLDGDTLHMSSYHGKDKNRPANFDPPKDSDTQHVVYRRVK